MPYQEGDSGALLLRQNEKKLCECPTDTTLVQLKPLRPTPEVQVTEPQDVVRMVKDMVDFDREHMRIVHLDSKNKILGIETVGIGLLDAALFHPREVLKGAILDNSSGIIMVHNHPSGTCDPSPNDETVAQVLEKACELVGIRFLDNIIIGKQCFTSQSCSHCMIPG